MYSILYKSDFDLHIQTPIVGQEIRSMKKTFVVCTFLIAGLAFAVAVSIPGIGAPERNYVCT